jgi:uncharacterized membrane protein (DUF106 family)
MGQEAEKAKAMSAWHRLWAWSIVTLGMGGTVALCVFFPAIIPILGQLLGWIVGMVPQLANWLGVVSVKAYQRSVSAYQEAKRKAALKGDQATLDMLRQTAAENTEPDADLVRQVKAKAGYVQSETEVQMTTTSCSSKS